MFTLFGALYLVLLYSHFDVIYHEVLYAHFGAFGGLSVVCTCWCYFLYLGAFHNLKVYLCIHTFVLLFMYIMYSAL